MMPMANETSSMLRCHAFLRSKADGPAHLIGMPSNHYGINKNSVSRSAVFPRQWHFTLGCIRVSMPSGKHLEPRCSWKKNRPRWNQSEFTVSQKLGRSLSHYRVRCSSHLLEHWNGSPNFKSSPRASVKLDGPHIPSVRVRKTDRLLERQLCKALFFQGVLRYVFDLSIGICFFLCEQLINWSIN